MATPFPPAEAADGMIKRYGSHKKALEWAWLHWQENEDNQTARDYWRAVIDVLEKK